MKLLILSDSHGNVNAMMAAAKKEHPDRIIHLGDCWRDATALKRLLPEIPIYRVQGNCDSYSYEPGKEDVLVWKFEDLTFYMTHGHQHAVKMSCFRLYLAAKEVGARIALFGHTHCSYCEEHDGGLLMNPGSCNSTVAGTYGIIEIQGQDFRCEIRRIPRENEEDKS